mgnify:CR=1 FL=1
MNIECVDDLKDLGQPKTCIARQTPHQIGVNIAPEDVALPDNLAEFQKFTARNITSSLKYLLCPP